jgi:hypothetical protein
MVALPIQDHLVVLPSRIVDLGTMVTLAEDSDFRAALQLKSQELEVLDLRMNLFGDRLK